MTNFLSQRSQTDAAATSATASYRLSQSVFSYKLPYCAWCVSVPTRGNQSIADVLHKGGERYILYK